MSTPRRPPLPDHAPAASLRDVFNAEAARAAADYPVLAGRLLIIDVAGEYSVAHIAPEALKMEPGVAAELQKLIERRWAKTAHSCCHINNGIRTIVMAPHVTAESAMYGLPQRQETLFILDHEIGHLVVKDGYEGIHTNFKENAADAFALIRYAQRFGRLEQVIEASQFKRIFDFAFKGRWSHYTVPMTDALLRLQDSIDLAALNPAQTAELAHRLATRHAINSIQLRELQNAFSISAAVYKDDDANIEKAAFAMVRQMARRDAHPLFFDSGLRLITALHEGKMKVHGKDVTLRDARWPRIIAKFNRRRALAGKDGLLLGLPVKKPATIGL